MTTPHDGKEKSLQQDEVAKELDRYRLRKRPLDFTNCPSLRVGPSFYNASIPTFRVEYNLISDSSVLQRDAAALQHNKDGKMGCHGNEMVNIWVHLN